jgi:putative acetyltransferase
VRIREALASELNALADIWLESVRATHTFLTEADVQELLPVVRERALPGLELWVLTADDDVPIGFMGLSGSMVEALFITPAHLGRGGGRMLLDHARRLKGPLRVDVNQQNPEGLKFYLACGFEVVGRSPTDADGRPFPLLHLREAGK